VRAGKVAGIGQLPRQTDWSREASFKLVTKTGVSAHR